MISQQRSSAPTPAPRPSRLLTHGALTLGALLMSGCSAGADPVRAERTGAQRPVPSAAPSAAAPLTGPPAAPADPVSADSPALNVWFTQMCLPLTAEPEPTRLHDSVEEAVTGADTVTRSGLPAHLIEQRPCPLSATDAAAAEALSVRTAQPAGSLVVTFDAELAPEQLRAVTRSLQQAVGTPVAVSAAVQGTAVQLRVRGTSLQDFPDSGPQVDQLRELLGAYSTVIGTDGTAGIDYLGQVLSRGELGRAVALLAAVAGVPVEHVTLHPRR